MKTSHDQSESIKILISREQFRSRYWHERDPIVKDRLLWRAQTFRHLVHLLPNQTILELGSSDGLFTEQLNIVTRGENVITAAYFNEETPACNENTVIECIHLNALPGQLDGRLFDFVVAMDLIDKSNDAWFLSEVFKLLKPGGQIVFYESNPSNIILQFNRLFRKFSGKKDRRHLAKCSQIHELISRTGFKKITTVYNDFVYAPLTSRGVWLLRNLSILLENLPYVQTLAGSILIHAQKPPESLDLPVVSLCYHEELKGKLSVVVPCYNEEMNIIPLVKQLIQFYAEYLFEIILVDDNSTDNTKSIITTLANANSIIKPVFRTPPNGVGRAITDGYKAAKGEYILSMDCDFQQLVPEFRDLFDALVEGNDVVIGSRFSRHSVLHNYPFQKIVANRAFHFIARVMFSKKFRDVTNNLKLMRRRVLEKMELSQPGFAINAETGLIPILMGYKVTEVPISWINRTPEMGVSSFKLVRVGGGYWNVLINLWIKFVLKKRPSPRKKPNNN